MEVMTYILWLLLIMGSVLKNYLLLASVPRSGQAMPAGSKKAAPLWKSNGVNKKVIDFAEVLKRTTNNQGFGWVDTS